MVRCSVLVAVLQVHTRLVARCSGVSADHIIFYWLRVMVMVSPSVIWSSCRHYGTCFRTVASWCGDRVFHIFLIMSFHIDSISEFVARCSVMSFRKTHLNLVGFRLHDKVYIFSWIIPQNTLILQVSGYMTWHIFLVMSFRIDSIAALTSRDYEPSEPCEPWGP